MIKYQLKGHYRKKSVQTGDLYSFDFLLCFERFGNVMIDVLEGSIR